MQSKKVQKKAVIKALILAAFIILAVILVRFSPIKEFLTVDQLEHFLESAGMWSVFMVIYAVGVCLFVPGTVLDATGAILFGAYWGIVYDLVIVGGGHGSLTAELKTGKRGA